MTRFAGRELPRAPPAQSRTSGLPAYGLYGAYFVKGGAHRFSPRLVLFILLFDPAASILPPRPRIAIAVARSEGQGRRASLAPPKACP